MTAINPVFPGGTRQHEASPQAETLAGAEPGFFVSSPCQRQWFVPFAAVARDYADFLVAMDKLSPEKALAKVDENLEFVPTWFYEQCNSWSDIERLGRLVQTSPLFKTKSALDRRRGAFGAADIQEQGVEAASRAGSLAAALNPQS